MRVNLSIEARMTSTRLPGKVLMPAAGVPLLEIQLKKVKQCRLVNNVLVATTTNSTDDPIVELCKRLDVPYFRGSEPDVLQRVVDAHKKFGTELIVELTGDNPLQDPALVDQCVRHFLDNEFDYVSNSGPNRKYPDGMNVQVFPLKVLEEACRETSDPKFHEHVSMYIYRSGKYKLSYIGPESPELIWPELNFTVDTRPEYEFVKAVTEQFSDINFSLRDLIGIVRSKPELLYILRKQP